MNSNESNELSNAASVMGQKGGSATSPAKRLSSRENGKSGGRPLARTIIVDQRGFDGPDLPIIGKTYLVYEQEYVGPNNRDCETAIHWTDDPRMLSEGFPGNSNPLIRQFHGWRGTDCDWATHALGVRKCLSITRKSFRETIRYHVKFGTDQKRKED